MEEEEEIYEWGVFIPAKVCFFFIEAKTEGWHDSDWEFSRCIFVSSFPPHPLNIMLRYGFLILSLSVVFVFFSISVYALRRRRAATTMIYFLISLFNTLGKVSTAGLVERKIRSFCFPIASSSPQKKEFKSSKKATRTWPAGESCEKFYHITATWRGEERTTTPVMSLKGQ